MRDKYLIAESYTVRSIMDTEVMLFIVCTEVFIGCLFKIPLILARLTC